MKNRFQNHQQLNNIVINAQAKNCELQKMESNQNRTTVKQRKKRVWFQTTGFGSHACAPVAEKFW